MVLFRGLASDWRRRLAVCVLTVLFIVGVVWLSARPGRLPGVGGAPADPLTARHVEEVLAGYVEDIGLPGASAAVVQNGRVVTASGTGHTSTGQPLDGTTRMRIASLSKAFTAAAVMQLVAAGRIKLDGAVSGQLPGFELADHRGKKITVRFLLQQRSGLSDATAPVPSLLQADSAADYLHQLSPSALRTDPGTHYEYSNTNYDVLAALVEAASGMRFNKYLSQYMFSPLGMVHTSTGGAQPPDRGYNEMLGWWYTRDELDGWRQGSGAVVTTAADMSLWLLAQLGQRPAVIDPASLIEMHTAGPGQDYAMGWVAGRSPGGQAAVDHSGNLFTYTSALMVVPGSNDAVVVLLNSATIQDLAYPLMTDLIGLTEGIRAGPAPRSLRVIDTVAALLIGATLIAAVLGFARSTRWAIRRRQGRGWVLVLRLSWLLIPGLVLGGTRLLIEYLSGGRSVRWSEVIALAPVVVLVLAVASLAGLVVLSSRVVRLRFRA